MSEQVPADPGSFRDPLSRVFLSDDLVLRGFRGRGAEDFEALSSSGLLSSLVDAGELIATDPADASVLGDGWDRVVSHPRLALISYPYEWSFSMLKDAALLQLRLTLAALEAGLSTKDATPYNVQFRGSSPVFIDVGSFEVPEPGSPWYGYRQFCALFLNPLILQSRLDVPFQPWLRGSTEGIAPSDLAKLMRWRDRFNRSVLTHVSLHARAERRYADSSRDVGAELKSAGMGPAIVKAQVRGLVKTVEKLRWEASESTWSDYSERPHYADEDLVVKEQFVRKAIDRPRSLVWDLGANDGHFSRIAAEQAELVAAVDSDALVIDRLYRTLRAENNETILPLAMDLVDSSPSLGWRGMERPGFFGRSKPDLVLALALVHHMAISATVPIPQIVDWLADMDAEVVVEIPHHNDPMVKRILRNKRAGLFDGYGLDAFDQGLRAAFDVRAVEELPGGTRTLYHLTPRS